MSEESLKNEKQDKTDKQLKTEKQDKAEKALKTDKNEKVDKQATNEKNGKADKKDKTDKTDKKDKADKADKSSRPSRRSGHRDDQDKRRSKSVSSQTRQRMMVLMTANNRAIPNTYRYKVVALKMERSDENSADLVDWYEHEFDTDVENTRRLIPFYEGDVDHDFSDDNEEDIDEVEVRSRRPYAPSDYDDQDSRMITTPATAAISSFSSASDLLAALPFRHASDSVAAPFSLAASLLASSYASPEASTAAAGAASSGAAAEKAHASANMVGSAAFALRNNTAGNSNSNSNSNNNNNNNVDVIHSVAAQLADARTPMLGSLTPAIHGSFLMPLSNLTLAPSLAAPVIDLHSAGLSERKTNNNHALSSSTTLPEGLSGGAGPSGLFNDTNVNLGNLAHSSSSGRATVGAGAGAGVGSAGPPSTASQELEAADRITDIDRDVFPPLPLPHHPSSSSSSSTSAPSSVHASPALSSTMSVYQDDIHTLLNSNDEKTRAIHLPTIHSVRLPLQPTAENMSTSAILAALLQSNVSNTSSNGTDAAKHNSSSSGSTAGLQSPDPTLPLLVSSPVSDSATDPDASSRGGVIPSPSPALPPSSSSATGGFTPTSLNPESSESKSSSSFAVAPFVGGRLYLGGWRRSAAVWLRYKRVKLVVNAATIPDILAATSHGDVWLKDCEDLEKEGVRYHRLDWFDTEKQRLWRNTPWDELVGAVKAVHGALSKGENVFVHCRKGRSRSATVVLAYLMARRGLSRVDALELLLERRPSVAPNSYFLSQLWEFERSVELRDLRVQIGLPFVQEAALEQVRKAEEAVAAHLAATKAAAEAILKQADAVSKQKKTSEKGNRRSGGRGVGGHRSREPSPIRPAQNATTVPAYALSAQQHHDDHDD